MKITIKSLSRQSKLPPRKVKEVLGISQFTSPETEVIVQESQLKMICSYGRKFQSAKRMKTGAKRKKRKRRSSTKSNPWAPNGLIYKRTQIISIGKFHY